MVSSDMKTDFLGIRSLVAGAPDRGREVRDATAEHAQDPPRKASAFGQTNQALAIRALHMPSGHWPDQSLDRPDERGLCSRMSGRRTWGFRAACRRLNTKEGCHGCDSGNRADASFAPRPMAPVLRP